MRSLTEKCNSGIINQKKGKNMSANNCIMVLKSPKDNKPFEYEWRVKHIFAIDDITYLSGKDVGEPVALRIFEKMKGATVFEHEDEANDFAEELASSYRILEYGIQVYQINLSWRDMVCYSLTEIEDEILYYSTNSDLYPSNKPLIVEMNETKEEILQFIEQVNQLC